MPAPPPVSLSSQRFWVCLLGIMLLFTVQGIRLAQRMVTWPDESAYLHLGYLAASGRISLFQDEIIGTRMPIPFYVLGATQLVWGGNLMAARLAAIVIGLGALVLVALIARHLTGADDRVCWPLPSSRLRVSWSATSL